SRLGHTVALLSKLGNDVPGKFILDACERDHIDTSRVVVDDRTDTSIHVGLVTADGERTFVSNRNGSVWKLNIDDLDMSGFGYAKLLSLASIFNSPLLDGPSLVQIFKQAKEQGLIICADMIKPRLGETLEDIGEALSYVDYFFPNYEEAQILTKESEVGAIADAFLAHGVKNVVIKYGKKGCFIKNANLSMTVATYKQIRAIDTIGAGDNFVAGFITAILDGKELIECARFANATASIAVQSVGATTGVKDRSRVDELYEKYEEMQNESN
ncbi:MAG: sugar kinase, partial [Spirochaetia bacterium]|nr:sugar kinase [Spirochaetia bacterium]